MNTSSSTRFGFIARSTLGAMAFVSLVGVAQSQTTSAASVAVPAEKGTSKDVQKVQDPGSPFVWDALGATPSIRLPWQSAKPSASVGEQKVDKADKAEKAAPSAAGVVEARVQGAQAAR
jgi:hypothetical protein